MIEAPESALSPTAAPDTYSWRIAELLRERLAKHRHEAYVQLAFAIVFTPLVVSLFIFLFAAMSWDFIDRLPAFLVYGPREARYTVHLLFGFFVAYFLAAPVPDRVLYDGRWLAISVWSWIAMVAITYVPIVHDSLGSLFWPAFIALGVFTFGALGHAYEPKDAYYLGWLGGLFNNPFTLRDNLDRRHLMAGYFVVLPSLVTGLWSDLFSGHGMLRGADPDDLDLAVTLLRRLDEDGAGPSEWLLAHGTRRPARVLRMLGRLGYLLPMEGGLCLTLRAQDLLKTARELRGA